jgi:hypothetical protein
MQVSPKSMHFENIVNMLLYLCTTPWRLIGGAEVKLHVLKISALDGDEWSA